MVTGCSLSSPSTISLSTVSQWAMAPEVTSGATPRLWAPTARAIPEHPEHSSSMSREVLVTMNSPAMPPSCLGMNREVLVTMNSPAMPPSCLGMNRERKRYLQARRMISQSKYSGSLSMCMSSSRARGTAKVRLNSSALSMRPIVSRIPFFRPLSQSMRRMGKSRKSLLPVSLIS